MKSIYYKMIGILTLLTVLTGTIMAGDKASEIDALMSKYHEYGQFNGSVLVAEDGKVLLKKGYGQANMDWKIPNAPDTKFRIGSVTKQFTATIILQLVEEGKVKLDGRIIDYLPDYREDTGSRVTIHHLLNHSSGIPNFTSIPGFWTDSTKNNYTEDYIVKHFCSGDLEFEPGSDFRYNNSGYFLLGAIIEKVTGKSFDEVLQERILKPAGMKNSGMDTYRQILDKRATGYFPVPGGFVREPYFAMVNAFTAGAMYSTVEDMLNWDRILYSDKLLSEKSKERMFSNTIPAFGGHYGYGWTIRHIKLGEGADSVKVIEHGGGINGFNTLNSRLTDDKKLIVLFNNTGSTNLQDMRKGIVQILYGKPYEQPKKSIVAMLQEKFDKDGIKAGIEKYQELKRDAADEYDFSEPQLNQLGYQLLQGGKVDAAIAVFKLNVEVFPESSNVYDSLGEAYLAKGKKKLAVKNYAKSLELDPDNHNAIRMLQKTVDGK